MSDVECPCDVYEYYDLDCDCDFVAPAEVRKSQKVRRCEECLDPIEAGDQYIRLFSVCEGDACAYVACLPCWRIRISLAPCANFGDLRNFLMDRIGTDYVTGEDVGGGERWVRSKGASTAEGLARPDATGSGTMMMAQRMTAV